ncbi:GspH/FimT family pseudopilin [Variovorax sp. J22R133]|uniref:GspH/FimT family pseudopilin n=1 Tax=Variovorax brevis TaxID=3053503 RepID=UPI002577E970|nr:GspH/FimT family pseudopilin [Variovorax sp. J22R133]MDM0115269.1 GspH/FimT family pseudopilin [Variovorax sp. J22R133]
MRGFTLIELMVTITVLGVLSVFAYPSYANFIQNTQIRSAAESVVSGLQIARAEAIRGNKNVQFQLLNTSATSTVTGGGGTDWSVVSAAAATPTVFDQTVQTRYESSATSKARVGTATTASATVATAGAGMPATITFTGMGRTTTTIQQLDFTGASGTRNLRVLIAPGGDVRLCDPAFALSANPQGCS